MSREPRREKLNIARTVAYSALESMEIQMTHTAGEALKQACLLWPLRAVIQPYLGFNPTESLFQVLLQYSDIFVSLRQQETLSEARSALNGPDGVDASTRNRASEIDEAIRFLIYSMLENVSEVLPISQCIAAVINGYCGIVFVSKEIFFFYCSLQFQRPLQRL